MDSLGKVGCVIAMVFLMSAGSAWADVTDMYIGVEEGQTSLWMEDGSWDLDDDWGFTINEDGSADSWVNEHWIGMDPVGLIGWIDTDETDPNIDITKNITNDTGFDWTGFDIILSWDEGTDVDVIESSVSSDQFNTVLVLEGFPTSNSTTMQFSNGLVPQGGSASFFFSFDILGDINFKIDQFPIPEPSALAMLLAFGGFSLIRRR